MNNIVQTKTTKKNSFFAKLFNKLDAWLDRQMARIESEFDEESYKK